VIIELNAMIKTIRRRPIRLFSPKTHLASFFIIVLLIALLPACALSRASRAEFAASGLTTGMTILIGSFIDSDNRSKLPPDAAHHSGASPHCFF
jgi:hypothetical protein